MNFLGIGPGELLLIMLLALIVFGPGKLPEIGRGLGRAIGEFRRATSEITEEFNRELSLDSLLEEPRKGETAPSQRARASEAAAPPSAPTATAVAEPPKREEVPAEQSVSGAQAPDGAGAAEAEGVVAAETRDPAAAPIPEEAGHGKRSPDPSAAAPSVEAGLQ